MASENNYEYMPDCPINDLLVCDICQYPFNDPRSTPCEHTFCDQCIKRWLARTSSCPTCRNSLSVNELKLTDRIVIRMIDQLKVKCGKCGQTDIERGNFNDHVEKTCMNSTVSCPSAVINCQRKGSRDLLNDHIAVCTFESLRPMISNIIDENRQLKQKVQQLEANNQHERNVRTRVDPHLAQFAIGRINSTDVTRKLV